MVGTSSKKVQKWKLGLCSALHMNQIWIQHFWALRYYLFGALYSSTSCSTIQWKVVAVLTCSDRIWIHPPVSRTTWLQTPKTKKIEHTFIEIGYNNRALQIWLCCTLYFSELWRHCLICFQILSKVSAPFDWFLCIFLKFILFILYSSRAAFENEIQTAWQP